MIKRLTVGELQLGMYICGVEKAGSKDPEFFMNNILIRTEKDIADFARSNHRSVYVEIKDPPSAPGQPVPIEAAHEEETRFGELPSTVQTGPYTEEATPFDELTESEEPVETGEERPDLMGLFDHTDTLDLEPERNACLTEPYMPELEPAAFDEDDGPAQELQEPEAAEDAEYLSVPEDVVEPEALIKPHAIEESEAIEDLEPIEEPEAVIEPAPLPKAEAIAEPEAVEERPSTEEDEACVAGVPVAAPLRLVEKAAGGTGAQEEIRDTVSFEEELREARKVRGEAEDLVRVFMDRVRIDGDIMPDRVNQTVGKMVESVLRNQDALASLSRLKNRDDYTFGHCVNVCILSLAIGRHMGLGEGPLNELGVGALLHDIGKMLVPEEILKKPGPLTSAELKEMQKHTSLGGELLYKTREISEASRAVAMHHHEKYDGSGYCDRLSGMGIHIYARIGAVADVYDAMTSDRVYQKGMSAEVALRRLYQFKGVHFDPLLVDRIIKCLGIYPIGTLVELNTGEVAVVSMTNHADPLKPRVLMLYDRSKRRLPGPVDINLGTDMDRWITASRDAGPLSGLIEKLIA